MMMMRCHLLGAQPTNLIDDGRLYRPCALLWPFLTRGMCACGRALRSRLRYEAASGRWHRAVSHARG